MMMINLTAADVEGVKIVADNSDPEAIALAWAAEVDWSAPEYHGLTLDVAWEIADGPRAGEKGVVQYEVPGTQAAS